MCVRALCVKVYVCEGVRVRVYVCEGECVRVYVRV